MKVWLPRDAAAKALGAEDVARAILAEASRRGVAVELVRNGSRGMVWLEPLAEVEVNGVRHAFGPMTPADVPGLFGDLAAHHRALGPTGALPWMARQTRLTFARVGVTDPLSLDDYRAHGGLAGLARAQGMAPDAVVAEVTDSGLRGRGGAGFPTGIKWKTVAVAKAAQKYIVCNADEGDSGTFADRMLMEGDPFCLIEGMAIAGLAVGATKGFVYIRSEYPDAVEVMTEAVRLWAGAGLTPGFDVEIRVGAGAYVCGEETSLLNSLEGKRGVVRAKPPLPALQGFMGRPTVVNNVISLASVPWIMANGAAAYRDFGIGRSRGTMPLQIAGNVRHGGLFECAFGLTLGEIVDDIAGGTASGRPVKAVQVGGPLGAYFPRALFDTPFGYEDYAAKDGLIGHAGIVVFDDGADMLAQARFAMEFCAIESCGKCTPCRIGAVRGVETVDRIARGDTAAIPLLQDLCATMKSGSLCALGGFTPYPVLSALTHFPDDFARAREAAQ
jgi:formate dehydrogenase iron-sulfur subunit